MGRQATPLLSADTAKESPNLRDSPGRLLAQSPHPPTHTWRDRIEHILLSLGDKPIQGDVLTHPGGYKSGWIRIPEVPECLDLEEILRAKGSFEPEAQKKQGHCSRS